MNVEPRCPDGYFQFEGMAPDGNARAWFLVAKNGILGHFQNTHNRNKQLEAYGIPEVIQNPSGVWAGLGRPDKQGAYCYSGRVTGRYIGDTSVHVPPPLGKVFVVHVGERRAQGGQFHITDWNWDTEANGKPGFPEDHDTRYGRQLWPRPD